MSMVLASLIPSGAEQFLERYGWIALFVLVLVQDVGIPTGVPGTVLVLFGGYLVFLGTINLHLAALSLAAGAFVGASGMFLLAQYGGRPLVLKVGRYIGLTEPRLDAAAGSLERWGPPMLLITRVAPGTRVYMTLFAGISGWTYRRFAFWTGVFVLLWAYTFVIIGDALGKRWETIARFILRFGFVLVLIIIALVIAYIINLVITNRRQRAAPVSRAPTATMPVPAKNTISADGARPRPTSAPRTNPTRNSKKKKREQRYAHSRPRR